MNIDEQAKACLKVWDELEKVRAAGQVTLALSILPRQRGMMTREDAGDNESHGSGADLRKFSV